MENIEIKDKIDSFLVEQNHNVVLRRSQNCMEMRKMTVSLIGIFMTAIIGMSEMRGLIKGSLWWSLIGVGIVILFWILEVYNFYQQELFRAKINKLIREIGKRHEYDVPEEKFVLTIERENSSKKYRIFRGIKNTYLFYLSIIALIIIGCICVKFMS